MAEDNDTILFVNANMDADPGTDGLLANLEPTIEDNAPIKESIVKIEDTSNDGYKQDSNKFRCKECPSYTTDCEDKMKRHIRKVHRGLNPYQCGMCEYSTSNSVLYQEHVWIHEGVKPYKCTHCEYTCVSKKNLKKHETIHDPDYPLRCKVCGHIARHNRALRCHMKEAHSDVEKNSKNFKCQYCGVQFSTELQHSNHRKARRRCDVCKKVLCRSEFAKHMLEHGVTKVEPPPKVKRYVFSCKLCKWSGSNTPKILLHLIHHPDQDLSECKVDLSVLKECGILPCD